MNLLDVFIIVLLFLAGTAGWAAGFVRRAAGWAGFAVGAVAGWQVARWLADETDAGGPVLRVLAAGTVVLTLGSLAGAVGEGIGRTVRMAVPRGPVRSLDAAGGALLGIAAVLFGVWLAFPVLAQVPGAVARQAHTSAIIDVVRDASPAAPESLQKLGDRLGKVRFPSVLPLQRAPDLGTPPPTSGLPDGLVMRLSDSTVNVEAFGCGRRHEGSGWAAGPDTVMTNAHVVAGADRVRVRRPDQRVLPGRVVMFDDNRDIAVLEVPGLGQPELPLASAGQGASLATIGYPGGADRPHVGPAAIRREQPTVGRDIYRDDAVTRQVLFLAARVRQGESGAPLVNGDGAVVGMVFARAPDREAVAYALDDSELRAALDAPRRPTTGSCL